MRSLAIARTSMRRIARDRTALFFMLVLPVFVILIIGTSVRGFSTFKVGVVDEGAGRAGQQLTSALRDEHNLELTRYPNVAAATKGVARGDVLVVVVLPRGMDATLRRGRAVAVGVMTEQANSNQQAAATAVDSVISSVGSRVEAAQFVTYHDGISYDASLQAVDRLAPHVPIVAIRTSQVEGSLKILPQGYSYSAPTMLVFFVFISALGAGANIIETRRLGMYERMAAAPVRIRTIVTGELFSYGALTLTQSAIIVAIGAFIFGVSWGDPLAAIALVLVWALVGAGAGMLAGTLFKTPEQASASGTVVGMLFGMLGGCMWPLAILSNTFREIGHIVPQAWAVDAWTSLLSRGGTITSIAPQLAILAGFAAVFFILATFRLRRALA
jgi:linearmycin/streptolysin S transport system permease protein